MINYIAKITEEQVIFLIGNLNGYKSLQTPKTLSQNSKKNKKFLINYLDEASAHKYKKKEWMRQNMKKNVKDSLFHNQR
jgi:hypothetical protein